MDKMPMKFLRIYPTIENPACEIHAMYKNTALFDVRFSENCKKPSKNMKPGPENPKMPIKSFTFV